jgi:hypothetical protein
MGSAASPVSVSQDRMDGLAWRALQRLAYAPLTCSDRVVTDSLDREVGIRHLKMLSASRLSFTGGAWRTGHAGTNRDAHPGRGPCALLLGVALVTGDSRPVRMSPAPYG